MIFIINLILYIYNENGQLSILCDFGGMAYKGMEDNPDTEIGFPFKVYYFDKQGMYSTLYFYLYDIGDRMLNPISNFPSFNSVW